MVRKRARLERAVKASQRQLSALRGSLWRRLFEGEFNNKIQRVEREGPLRPREADRPAPKGVRVFPSGVHLGWPPRGPIASLGFLLLFMLSWEGRGGVWMRREKRSRTACNHGVRSTSCTSLWHLS